MSEQVPDTSMNLEMLDGYLTALVVGPTTVMPSEYLPEIWGEDSDAAVYDSVEQAEHVTGLLMRHWNTIASRVTAGHQLSTLPHSRWRRKGISAQEVLGRRCIAFRRHPLA
jgi:yecA family protein